MADRIESPQNQAWKQFASAVQSKGASVALDSAANIEFFLSKLAGIKGVALDNYRLELLQKLDRFESEFGISYGDIYSTISAWNSYAMRYLRREFLDEPALRVFFGFNRNPSVLSGYTDSRFLDDVQKTINLLKVVEDAAGTSLAPADNEEKNEEVIVEEKKEDAKEVAVKKEEPKKTEERKKATSAEGVSEQSEGGSEEKEEKGAVVPNAEALKIKKSLEELKSVSEGDRQFRQEIVRMQQVSLRQLAVAYGVPEDQQAAFVQSLAADITPFITHEMLSLADGDLANALKSTSTRYDVYLKVMLRAQQSPQFQVALQKAVKKLSPEGKKLSTKEMEEVAKANRSNEEATALFQDLEKKGVVASGKEEIERAKAVVAGGLSPKQKNFLEKTSSITPESLVSAIRANEGGKGLDDGGVQKIVGLTRKKSGDFESELQTLLISGAGLTESQVKGIFSRLQSYAINRSNIEYISPDDFARVFGEGLGAEREVILGRIQKALLGSDVDWGGVLSSYVRSAKIDIVLRTGNTAALFSDSTREPSQTLIDQTQKEVFSRGFEAVSLGLYASRDALQKQLQQIEAGGVVESLAKLSGKVSEKSYSGTVVAPSFLVASSLGKGPSTKADLESALDFKTQGSQKLTEFMRSKPGIMKSLAENGFSAETYDEIHWAEKVEYLQSIFLKEDLTPEELRTTIVQFYIDEPIFLYEIGYENNDPAGEWYFYQPDGLVAYEEADYAPGFVAGSAGGVADLSSSEVSKKITARATKKASIIQKAAEQKKRKLIQAALTLALSAVPGGAALLPLLKAGFAAADSIRKMPGGEKLLKWLGKLADPDQIKRTVRNAMIGAAGLMAAGAAALASVLANATALAVTIGKTLLVGLAGGLGFLVGGPVGALLAGGAATTLLFGSEIATGLSAVSIPTGAGVASVGGGIASAISSGSASAIAGTKAFFSGLMGVTGGVSMVTGPIVGATMTVAVAGIYLNQDVIKAAFLTERTAISYGAPAARGLQVLGCWPTSGRITGIEEYCGGGAHKTMGNSTAIDISANMGTLVYAPFAGTATFYRSGSGLSSGYGNHVVLKADNGIKLIFGHLLDFGNFQSFDGASAQVSIGDVIGRVDNTGNSTGNHLHYEVWGGSFRDVVPNPDVGCGAQVISSCSPGSATQ